jgi:LPS O-antigen subunit length determinant protein (WzzB/FepE family)
MADVNHTEGKSAEIDLGVIIRELYRAKWLLAVLTLGVGVLAAWYAMRLPNVYQSSAALIVREPEAPISGDDATLSGSIPTLSVETLQSLAESTETTSTLFERLWDDKAVARWEGLTDADKVNAFRGFLGKVSTSLIKQASQARGTTQILPVLELHAKASSPDEARTIANAWADILEQESQDIYTEGVDLLDTFIAETYKQSDESLTGMEQALSAKKNEANLEFKLVRLEALRIKATELEVEIVDIESEIGINEVAIQEGTRRIAEQQYEGEWIGTVAEAHNNRGQAYPFEIDTLKPQARKTLDWVEQKAKQVSSLRAYRKDRNVLDTESRFQHHQANLDRVLREKAQVIDSLPATQATLDSLTEQLDTIPEKVSLEKAITDDSLWSAHLSGDLPDDAPLVPLNTQEQNVVFQTTRTAVVDAAAELEAYRSSLEQLEASANTAADRIGDLEGEIDVVTREIARRERELHATEAALTLLHQDYLAEIHTVEKLTVQTERLRDELRVKEGLLRAFVDDLRTLEQATVDFQREIDALERDVDKTKSAQLVLASKAQEAALLRISAEKASSTGTAILYHAKANPLKVAPVRSKMVLASMVVAFGLFSALVVGLKVVREVA